MNTLNYSDINLVNDKTGERNKTSLKSQIMFGTMVIFSVLSFFILLYNLVQVPELKRILPWPNNQIRAYKSERMANKFPPDNIHAKRLRAIADALKNNSSEYTFSTGPLPVSGGK